jgi:hypothetical protein
MNSLCYQFDSLQAFCCLQIVYALIPYQAIISAIVRSVNIAHYETMSSSGRSEIAPVSYTTASAVSDSFERMPAPLFI